MKAVHCVSRAIGFFVLIVIQGCNPTEPPGGSFEVPEDPLSTFELEDGFTIELVAAEPLMADPVAIEVDEFGNTYVLEMPGYPLDVSPNGRVRLLEDTDNDGVYDNSTIFADGLVLPTGLMRWKDGILVTAPPDVLYLADTDGDLKADHREVILTGFARSNPQHNFNKPLYGLDNWIYVANNGTIGTTAYKDQFGDRGSEVFFPAQTDGERLSRNANDSNVRFKPDSFELESLAGKSQFGHTFDAWGHHFLVDNSHPQFHEVMAARYLDGNPLLSRRLAMHYTPTYGRNAAIFPITRDPEHMLLTDRGMITSAAGITYYLGGLFPESYDNISLVGEPVHNLVHVLRVRENGATFTAERLHERREFLASTDSWFRPVNFYTGPDGAVYLIDYYRQIVEHPEWMDEETARSGKLKNGSEMGRLYRITPDGTPPASWMNTLELGNASSEELVIQLESNNIWRRRTAQRLIVDRADNSMAPLLSQLIETSESPEGRLHALWTLDGLEALTDNQILDALRDPHHGVRENAILLAEKRISRSPQLNVALLNLENDPHARVRFQLLCTLGMIDSPASRAAQQRMLEADLDNEWTQLAALAANNSVDAAYVERLLPMLRSEDTAGRRLLLQRLAAMTMSSDNTSDVDWLRELAVGHDSADWWRVALLNGLTEGVSRSNLSVTRKAQLRNHVLEAFSSTDQTTLRDGYLELLKRLPRTRDEAVNTALQNAHQTALSSDRAPAVRAQSIALLAHLTPNDYINDFKSLISATQPQDVQVAATKACGAVDDADISDFFVSSWAELTPTVRNVALDQMMRTTEGMGAILAALENNTIQTSAIGWNRTVRLMRDTEDPLRDRARQLLSEPPGVREQVVESYMASLDLDGNTTAGQPVFEANCSTCHQMAGDLGTAFGPDLSTVRHWTARALVAKILMPQRTIADSYSLWSVKQTNGTTTSGLMIAESPTSVTLRRLGQPDISIPRSEVETIESLNVSAMPDGLEAQINTQEMADLIAFLRFN